MKFAHEFKEALSREGYPTRWLDSAIPYSQLKKCLKKVSRELRELGLDPETLQQLLAAHAVSSEGDPVPVAKYNLDADKSKVLRPRLSIFVQLKDGEVVQASLSPASKQFLQKLTAVPSSSGLSGAILERPLDLLEEPEQIPSDHEDITASKHRYQRVEVPLVFDAEFFDILQNDVNSLDALQQEEQENLRKEVATLGHEVSAVTKPSRYSKNDISRWRELFELYLDAQVFFSTHERDHGARKSDVALRQLMWFQNQVRDRKLVEHFKLPASRDAYTRFLELNAALLRNLKFQEINKTAIKKILKKFDKRTALGVSSSFPAAINSRTFMAEGVAKEICSQVSQEVVSVVPRLDDYICPVCMSIAWLPVRLKCQHVFCVRCVIKMQREHKRQCPLCRGDVIMQADLANLDKDLEKFLRLYFRKETDEKQKSNEIERGIELFGESYKHSSCGVM